MTHKFEKQLLYMLHEEARMAASREKPGLLQLRSLTLEQAPLRSKKSFVDEILASLEDLLALTHQLD